MASFRQNRIAARRGVSLMADRGSGRLSGPPIRDKTKRETSSKSECFFFTSVFVPVQDRRQPIRGGRPDRGPDVCVFSRRSSGQRFCWIGGQKRGLAKAGGFRSVLTSESAFSGIFHAPRSLYLSLRERPREFRLFCARERLRRPGGSLRVAVNLFVPTTIERGFPGSFAVVPGSSFAPTNPGRAAYSSGYPGGHTGRRPSTRSRTRANRPRDTSTNTGSNTDFNAICARPTTVFDS